MSLNPNPNPNLNSRQVMKVIARTWTRDSHGLFDYETTGYTHSTLYLDNTINHLIRHRDDGKLEYNANASVNAKSNEDSNEESLITVNRTINDFYIINNNLPEKIEYPSIPIIKDLTQKAWYVINSDQDQNQSTPNTQRPIENEDYYLNQYDIIKLGRVKYVITEYKVKQQQSQLPLQQEKKENSYNISYENNIKGSLFNLVYQTERFEEIKGQQDKLCKICYTNDNEQDNPLINLCGCTGGIRYVHYQCLKTWMQTKLTFKENVNRNAKSYMLKGFNCEICQKAYPFKFQFKGEMKEYSLVDIKVPYQGEYIIFESLNQMKDKVNTKIIHVINLNQEQYVIGRGHECDVRINDISVSRAHAYLTYNKGNKKIMIKDLRSKFGTLVLIKTPLIITQKQIQLQIGRTVVCTQMVHRVNAEITANMNTTTNTPVVLGKEKEEGGDVIMNDTEMIVNELETVIEGNNKESHNMNNSVNGDDLSN